MCSRVSTIYITDNLILITGKQSSLIRTVHRGWIHWRNESKVSREEFCRSGLASYFWPSFFKEGWALKSPAVNQEYQFGAHKPWMALTWLKKFAFVMSSPYFLLTLWRHKAPSGANLVCWLLLCMCPTFIHLLCLTYDSCCSTVVRTPANQSECHGF